MVGFVLAGQDYLAGDVGEVQGLGVIEPALTSPAAKPISPPP